MGTNTRRPDKMSPPLLQRINRGVKESCAIAGMLREFGIVREHVGATKCCYWHSLSDETGEPARHPWPHDTPRRRLGVS